MNLRHSLAVLFALSLTASAATSALAIDSPTLELDYTSRTSIAVDVVAGSTGAPMGFTVEWMLASVHDQLGGWPAENDPRIIRMNFTGIPTLHVENTAASFQLGASELSRIEIGDLFDETGIDGDGTSELQPGVEYVIRVRANGDGSTAPSAYSETFRKSTQGTSAQNCTYTQGFWKNHGAGACQSGNNANVWPVASLTLGSVNYTAAQLCAIFNQPAQGNGLISLAHQLIAAKLNVAQGAVAPAAVAQAIADADALIGSLVVPPGGSGYLAPSATSGLTNTLDQFNNGEIGRAHV